MKPNHTSSFRKAATNNTLVLQALQSWTQLHVAVTWTHQRIQSVANKMKCMYLNGVAYKAEELQPADPSREGLQCNEQSTI